MKKPTCDCPHARYLIESKWIYSQKDYDDNEGICWKCKETLTLQKTQPATIDKINMDDKLREECEKNPDMARKVLELHHRPVYHCVPCFKKMTDEDELYKGPFIPIEEVFAELRNKEKYIADLKTRINEIETCVPDCPYRSRLSRMKENLQHELEQP